MRTRAKEASYWRVKGVEMSTQMPEGEGGDVARDLETEEQRRDREERERAEQTGPSQEESRPASEDDPRGGQGSGGGAV